MAKRKNNKQYLLTYPKNYFTDGGDTRTKIGAVSQGLADSTTSYLKNSQIADTSLMEANLKSGANRIIDPSTNQQLMDEYDAWSEFNNVNRKTVRGGSTGQRLVNVVGSVGAGAATGAAVANVPGAIIGGAIGLASSIGGWVTGGIKANKKTKELNDLVELSNQRRESTFINAIDNVDRSNDLNLKSNYFPYGGELNFLGDGGYTHGALWDNGVNAINNGGTHGENPFGGVPMGMDQQGVPNLVEEGEVKWKDYIFSNRMKAKEKDLTLAGLHTKYAKQSFADISKKISEESNERPNDPISKNGLENAMGKLAQIQEADRMKKEQRKVKNMFALGGPFEIYDEYAALEENYNNELDRKASILPSVSIAETKQITPETPLAPTWMRYAPAVGNGIMALTDAFGLTNKPDYATANMIGGMANSFEDVSANPIGNYLTYNPLDRNYHRNNLSAQAGATRRAITNNISPSTNASLLAADYNAGMAMGNLSRQAEEFNLAQRAQVEGFNRETNTFNVENALKAAQINQGNDELRLRARLSQADLMEKQNEMSSSAKSANMSNFFDSIGGIGQENFGRNMIVSNPALYYTLGANGQISYKDGFDKLSGEQQSYIKQHAQKAAKNKKADGGFLTIKGN